MIYVIDRIENNIAICEMKISDKSEADISSNNEFSDKDINEISNIKVNVSEFTFNAKEGMFFDLKIIDGKNVYSLIEESKTAESEQKKVIRNKLDRLFKRS